MFDNSAEYFARNNATYAVVTALEVEFLALKYVFGEPIELDARVLSPEIDVPVAFYAFRFTNSKGQVLPFIGCKSLSMGNNASAIITTALQFLFPNLGSEERCLTDKEMEGHVCIGDVVISEGGIIQYDFVALTPDGVAKPKVTPVHTNLTVAPALSRLKEDVLAREPAWDKHIAEAYDMESCPWSPNTDSDSSFYPMFRDEDNEIVVRSEEQELQVREGFERSFTYVHFGLIGSANILLRDFETRDRIKNRHGMLAVEMEGSGAMDAAKTLGRSALCIRASCDFGDHRKGDAFHYDAAMNAAGVLKTLLSYIR